MLSKKRKMLLVYYLPLVLTVIRVIITFWFFVENPLQLGLRFIQGVPLLVYLFFTFTYYKLYHDGVPVITIVVPTILHGIVVFVFQRQLALVPLGVLFALDVLFLILRSIKSNLYPFDIDNDDEDEDLIAMEDYLEDAE